MKNISSGSYSQSSHCVRHATLYNCCLNNNGKRVAFIVQEPQEMQCHCDCWHEKGIDYVSTVWNKDLFHLWMTFWSVVIPHTKGGTLTGLAEVIGKIY